LPWRMEGKALQSGVPPLDIAVPLGSPPWSTDVYDITAFRPSLPFWRWGTPSVIHAGAGSPVR